MKRYRRRRSALIAAALLGPGLFARAALAQDEPPPPPAPHGPSNATDENKDSGLGLEWVYLNADVGYSYVNMTSFSESTLGLSQTAGSGVGWGVGAGVRFFFLSAGARLRNMSLDNPGSLWTVDLEGALHMRIWHIDPYIGVRGGYAWVGSFSSSAITNAAMAAPPPVAVHGVDVGPMLGIDIYFTSLISIGAEGQASFLFLQRPPVPLPPQLQGAAGMQAFNMLPPAEQQLYSESGSSVGFGATATAHLGIHF